MQLAEGTNNGIMSSIFNGIAVDKHFVYWGESGLGVDNGATGGAIKRIPIGGGQVTVLKTGRWSATAVAVNATNIYWTGDVIGALGAAMTMPLSGGNITTLWEGNLGAGIALDDSAVYVADASDGAGQILKAPLGGGVKATALASNQQHPWGIAVDANSVYWANQFGNSIMRIPKNGGAPVTLASKQGSAFSVAVDGDWVYCVEGSPDPSKFDGPVEVGSVGDLLSKRAVVRGLKVDRAAVPV